MIVGREIVLERDGKVIATKRVRGDVRVLGHGDLPTLLTMEIIQIVNSLPSPTMHHHDMKTALLHHERGNWTWVRKIS
jgi:hypothetical protein